MRTSNDEDDDGDDDTDDGGDEDTAKYEDDDDDDKGDPDIWAGRRFCHSPRHMLPPGAELPAVDASCDDDTTCVPHMLPLQIHRLNLYKVKTAADEAPRLLSQRSHLQFILLRLCGAFFFSLLGM